MSSTFRDIWLGENAMSVETNGPQYNCVIVDLNTQYDFCDLEGQSPVANVETLLPALRRTVAWTKRNAVPVVSSVETHRCGELSDSGHALCCIDGTRGQEKIEFTLLGARTYIEVDNMLCCPIDLFGKYQQVIFRKRSDDLLLNPKADRFLTQIPTREFLVVGTGLENSIRSLVLGLRARGRRVLIVEDACGFWERTSGELAIRQMVAKGARRITVDKLLKRKLPRRIRYDRHFKSESLRSTRTSTNDNGRHSRAKHHPDAHRLPDRSDATRIPPKSDGLCGSGQ